MKPLDQQVAIVTGAAHPKGIGRAIAMKLAAQGAHVAIVDLAGAEGLSSAVEPLLAQGVKAIAVACDVSNREDVGACVRRVIAELGGVDMMVNNAGVGVGSIDFLAVSDKDWDLSLQVNVKGVANCWQAVIPSML